MVMLIDRACVRDPRASHQNNRRAASKLLFQGPRVAVARQVKEVPPAGPLVEGNEARIGVHHSCVKEVITEECKVEEVRIGPRIKESLSQRPTIHITQLHSPIYSATISAPPESHTNFFGPRRLGHC